MSLLSSAAAMQPAFLPPGILGSTWLRHNCLLQLAVLGEPPADTGPMAALNCLPAVHTCKCAALLNPTLPPALLLLKLLLPWCQHLLNLHPSRCAVSDPAPQGP